MLQQRIPRMRMLLQTASKVDRCEKSRNVSGYDSAVRRSKIVHRQSSKWRTPTRPATGAKGSDRASTGTRLLLSYHDLERALERRGLNTARVLVVGACAGLVGVAFAWPRIKKWGALEGAEVAAASLEQEELQEKAGVLLYEVLADEKTGVKVGGLVKGAFEGLLEDEEFRGTVVEWTAGVLKEALTWEEVQKEGREYVRWVLEDEVVKEAAEVYLKKAVADVVRDEGVQEEVGKSLWSSVKVGLIGRRRPRESEAKEVGGENGIEGGKQDNKDTKVESDSESRGER